MVSLVEYGLLSLYGLFSFKILEAKYRNKEQGRIPLPNNVQQLWSQHKYSVLARDVNLYKKIGKQVSAMSPNHDFSVIAKDLAELLRTRPSLGGIKNALQHMWGYVSATSGSKRGFETWSLNCLTKLSAVYWQVSNHI